MVYVKIIPYNSVDLNEVIPYEYTFYRDTLDLVQD